MSMPASPPPTTWQVTGQTEYTQVATSGAPVQGVKVFYTTGQGHSGSVFLPSAQYSPANVRQAVNAAAVTMDQVGALTGQVGQQ